MNILALSDNIFLNMDQVVMFEEIPASKYAAGNFPLVASEDRVVVSLASGETKTFYNKDAKLLSAWLDQWRE